LSTQVEAVVIAGAVALVTALIGFTVTVWQARRERSKWLVDFKSTTTLELYRQRLSTYPAVFEIIGRLSHGADPKPNASTAGQVALELNNWIYGSGGLCAEAGARGALLGLRLRCAAWAASGDHDRPADLYEWRNLALARLRLDIDLAGLENYDFDNMPSALQRLKGEVDQMVSDRSAARPTSARWLGKRAGTGRIHNESI